MHRVNRPLTEKQLEALRKNQWKPGTSGNPAGAGPGRPRSFGELVRELTADGKIVVELAVSIVRGEVSASPAVRLEAGRWLVERGFGKTPDVSVTADATDTAAGAELATEMRDVIRQALEQVETRDAQPASDTPEAA